MHELMPQLSPSEARVAQYILLNLPNIAFETGASIAEKAAVSSITVSRFLKRAGYKGIAALKQEIQQELAPVQGRSNDDGTVLTDDFLKSLFDKDLKILVDLYKQLQSDSWQGLVNCVASADQVYVSGFQTIRGAAEDFARRLSLARTNVQFLSANDSNLGEWLAKPQKSAQGYTTFILIDVVPYAQQGRRLCELAAERGMQVVILTDEFCYWARDFTPYIFHAKSKTGLFLESTWGLLLATNMLVDQVARKNPGSDARARAWLDIARHLNLF
nr:MurR/RpiR family transcriptional regulator [Oceanobacter mangrovi]